MTINRQLRLRSRPAGMLAADDVEIVAAPMPARGAGEVLVKVLYASLDPGMLVFLRAPRPLPGVSGVGEVINAWGVGRVVESDNPAFPVGSHVRDHGGHMGIQDYSVLPETDLIAVDPALAPLPAHLNVLGMPALTAYFGMVDIGRPRAGETVLVSAASGAVGAVAGQIARIAGARVVGIAGGPEKCRRLVEEQGFDAAIDYRAGDIAAALAEHCPRGVDVYFDNVAGELLDQCLLRMALGGRIVFCGGISQYAAESGWAPLRNYAQVLSRQLTWKGLSYYAYADRYAEGVAQLADWVREGKLRHGERVVTGLENFHPAFVTMFGGGEAGKLVLEIGEGV